MKEDIEFEKIGKNIRYEVPDGFFENISQRTLQKIKQKEQRQKRVLRLSKIMAVAASLAILVSIAFLLSRSGTDWDKRQLTEQKRVESPQKLKQEIPEKTPADRGNASLEKPVPQKSAPVIDHDEKIDDVLTDLPEEDLLQLAVLYKADPFNDDSVK